MTIEPLGARVLIRPIEQETMTKSGIVLPETAKEKPQQGLIEAVGTEEEMLTAVAPRRFTTSVIFPAVRIFSPLSSSSVSTFFLNPKIFVPSISKNIKCRLLFFHSALKASWVSKSSLIARQAASGFSVT